MDGNNNFNQTPNPEPIPQPMPNQTNVYVQPETEAPITVGEWMLTILLTCIPCVNIIMLLVWAFGNNTPKTKSNWAKAQLIWTVIFVVLTIIIYAVVGAAMISAFQYY